MTSTWPGGGAKDRLRGDSRSSIIDSSLTMVIGGTLVKVIAWYDNEWAFSCRMADLVRLVADRLPAHAA